MKIKNIVAAIILSFTPVVAVAQTEICSYLGEYARNSAVLRDQGVIRQVQESLVMSLEPSDYETRLMQQLLLNIVEIVYDAPSVSPDYLSVFAIQACEAAFD